MSEVWDQSTVSAGEPVRAQPSPQTVAALAVIAAVLFNMVLCFVNTTLFGVSVTVVIAAEMAIIGTALSLVWYRGYTLYTILLLLSAYFFVVMLVRSEFDPKILRDLLIPIVFYFLGRYLGSLHSADRLVTFLIFLALGAALFEFLALNTYLHFFDVIHYYLARGTERTLQADTAAGLFIKGTGTAAGLFINATRFGARTLLPFLGEHRVSGIFLEPVSVGNFGAIAFAWVLLRDCSRIWVFAVKVLAIAVILVLADARFGCYLCIFTIVVYFAAPLIRPAMLFVAPFLMIIGLVTYAGAHAHELWDNTAAGRLLYAGVSLTTLDPWQLFGLRVSNIFEAGYSGDSGYGYVLVKIGLVGLSAIWALFVFTPALNGDAWRFKNFLAFYIVFLLAISASLFSIKTAALLWFLYGTLNNPISIAGPNSSATATAPFPKSAD